MGHKPAFSNTVQVIFGTDAGYSSRLRVDAKNPWSKLSPEDSLHKDGSSINAIQVEAHPLTRQREHRCTSAMFVEGIFQ